jgi:hypothetical protein
MLERPARALIWKQLRSGASQPPTLIEPLMLRAGWFSLLFDAILVSNFFKLFLFYLFFFIFPFLG